MQIIRALCKDEQCKFLSAMSSHLWRKGNENLQAHSELVQYVHGHSREGLII